MKFHEDWVEKARAVHIEDEIARRGIKLRGRIEREGPCPVCGGDDRFSINVKKQVWNCRGCGKGGDIIDLVEHLDGVDFRRACETLTGEPLPKPNGKDRVSEIRVAEYFYQDASGNVVFAVDRIEFRDADGNPVLKDGKRKTFRQRRPNPDRPGQWIDNVDGVPAVAYRLPELIEAIANWHMVLIVEGEAKVDLLRSWNVPATCCAAGAGKWKSEHSEFLRGASVVILPDADVSGRKHADIVGASLQGIAASVRVLDLPGLPAKGDIVDWVNAGGTVEQLHDLIERQAKPWTPSKNDDGETWEDAARPYPLIIKSSKEFVAGFVPPEYVVIGLLQRRFFYSLTGQTGAGKTAIMLLLAACVALGRAFAGRDTKPIRVLYLAAENADDVRMRWIAFAQQMNFDIDTIKVYFVEGRFSLSKSLQVLRAEAERRGGEFGMVVVDTGPTFFEGSDENENKQLGDHARMLRSLIDTVPGAPCVVANCHPTKNAQPDQLLPRGGGAFVAEVDGNLTAAKTDNTVELHWQGKFRGPDFAPMYFLIRTVTHQDLKDSDGRLLPTVIAEHISEQTRDDMAAAAGCDEDAVLAFISTNPAASLTTIATAMGWKLYSGEANKMKAGRCIKELIKARLIKKTRSGRCKLTPEGEKELNKDDE